MSPRKRPSMADDLRLEATEPVLQFAVLKALPYRKRMRWVMGLLVVGALAQLALLSVFPGLPFLLAAVVLAWVVGFDNRLDRRGLRPDRAWQRVDWENVRAIVKLDRAMKNWDASAVDVSSAAGCGVFGMTGIAIGAATVATGALAGLDAALVVGVDAGVLLLVQWFNGMRTIHRKPELVMKADHLAGAVDGARKVIDACGTLHGQLLLESHESPGGDDDEGGGSAPTDARVLVDVSDPPGRMLTVQGQVVLNRVQGTPYPYFYCVVLAGAREGLVEFADTHADKPPRNVTIETRSQREVDVVIVRQTTTKTSGYHTKDAASGLILRTALRIATAYRDAAATLPRR